MASHNKKEAEGIALLSIYGDEDDEMEEIDDDEQQQQQQQQQQREQEQEQEQEIGKYPGTDVVEEFTSISRRIAVSDENTAQFVQEERYQQQSRVLVDNSTPGIAAVSWGTPKDFVYSPSPQLKLTVVEQRRKERIAIVDYGQDEVAMSPEPEEGEIMASGQLMESEDLAVITGDFQEKTVQFQAPGDRTPNDQSETDAINHVVTESDSAEVAVMATAEEPKDIDILNKFLPPPLKAKCSDELQEKIIKFIALKKTTGRSYNAEVRNRKEYRNPDFLRHAVTYQDIDEIGSCFSKDVFDPHGYDKSDFYDELEADMRREMERKEQERKRSPKIDFFSGGTQIGTVSAPKINLPIPGLPVVPGSGLSTITAAVDTVPRDGRQNKKSKWDKVDGDRKTLLSTGGQDSVSAVAAHASLLSAANAGSGYSAYAEQRRREAEDKRSGDRKSDRRS